MLEDWSEKIYLNPIWLYQAHYYIISDYSNNGGVCTVPDENGSFYYQMKALIAKLTRLKY